MKKLFFLCLLLSVGCSRCFDSCNPTTVKYPPNIIPNEIIFDAEGLSAADYAAFILYLKSKNLGFRDSCNCSRKLELWGTDRDSVDVIGVITDARTQASTASGSTRLSPNIEIVPENIIPPNSEPRIIIDSTAVKNPSGPTVPTARIVIVDTGVDSSNSSRDMLWRSSRSCAAEGVYGLNVPKPTFEPTDGQGHGTHINGIVSGIPPNSGDQSGIHFEQINVKFTPEVDNKSSLFKTVCGLYYGLERGAQVFNLSWGYAGGDAPELINSFMKVAQTKNIIIVAGAGNNGTSNDTLKFWPASFSEKYPFVISVGAYNADSLPKYQLYIKTNVGASVNVFAPGVNVYSTYIGPKGAHAYASGTSMATAYVSRVAAIIRGKKPTWTAQQIKECIMNSSKGQPTNDGHYVKIFEAQKAIDACQ